MPPSHSTGFRGRQTERPREKVGSRLRRAILSGKRVPVGLSARWSLRVRSRGELLLEEGMAAIAGKQRAIPQSATASDFRKRGALLRLSGLSRLRSRYLRLGWRGCTGLLLCEVHPFAAIHRELIARSSYSPSSLPYTVALNSSRKLRGIPLMLPLGPVSNVAGSRVKLFPSFPLAALTVIRISKSNIRADAALPGICLHLPKVSIALVLGAPR